MFLLVFTRTISGKLRSFDGLRRERAVIDPPPLSDIDNIYYVFRTINHYARIVRRFPPNGSILTDTR